MNHKSTFLNFHGQLMCRPVPVHFQQWHYGQNLHVWDDGSSCTLIILGPILTLARGFHPPWLFRATHHCHMLLADHASSSLHYTMCHLYVDPALLHLRKHVFVAYVLLWSMLSTAWEVWYWYHTSKNIVFKLCSAQMVTLKPFCAFDNHVATTFRLIHIVLTTGIWMNSFKLLLWLVNCS
jgi:hypothetical protein